MKKKFNFNESTNRKQGSSTIGLQDDGRLWVLCSNLHLDENGQKISKEESNYVWLPHIALQNASSNDINSACLSPCINGALSTNHLKPLLLCMKQCFKHNFIPSVMCLGGILMALHYQTVLENYEGCSIPFLYGPSQTGKTNSSKIALALLGMLKRGFYKKSTSQKWFLERCSLSSMPFVIDDPRDIKDRKSSSATVQTDLLNLLNDIFDGGIVANLRTGEIRPRSMCLITSNSLPNDDK